MSHRPLRNWVQRLVSAWGEAKWLTGLLQNGAVSPSCLQRRGVCGGQAGALSKAHGSQCPASGEGALPTPTTLQPQGAGQCDRKSMRVGLKGLGLLLFLHFLARHLWVHSSPAWLRRPAPTLGGPACARTQTGSVKPAEQNALVEKSAGAAEEESSPSVLSSTSSHPIIIMIAHPCLLPFHGGFCH